MSTPARLTVTALLLLLAAPAAPAQFAGTKVVETGVNNATPYPTGGTFSGFTVPGLSGNTVVFSGTNGTAGPNPIGVFTQTGGGPLVTVANTSTPVPGLAGNFTAFSDPALGPYLPTV